MKTCVVCGNGVDRDVMVEEFQNAGLMPKPYDYARPPESYTENMQMVLDGEVCSIECYDQLD